MEGEPSAIERRCCAFIGIEYDHGDRRLTLTVRRPSEDPALDALLDVLGPRG